MFIWLRKITVNEQSMHIYSDKFFNQIDVVMNALDNV